MASARRRPERPMPDLGNVPVHVRDVIESLITRNRRDMRAHGRTSVGDEWLDAFLEGMYAGRALRTRDDVNRVHAAIKRDLMDTLTE